MAVAGRVAIVPKDDFDISATYKRLDMVRYEESLYVAKKASSGILPTDTEYWMLSIESISGDADGITYDNTESGLEAENVQAALDELADRSVIAQAPSEENPEGKLGNVKPDGKTITITEDGTITGSAVRTFDTEEEFRAAYDAGEVVDGMTVNIKDYNSGVIDSELSENSKNPVQNKVITEKLSELEQSVSDAADTVSEISNSLVGVQADIDNILDGTSQVGDAEKVGGLEKSNFMGKNTGYNYGNRVTGLNLNNILYDFHAAVFEYTNGPRNTLAFLDVSHYNNDTSLGGETVTRQVMFYYKDCTTFVRSKLNDEAWLDWTPLLTSDMVSNPQILINPNFKINQRNKTVYVYGSDKRIYTVDRWRANLHQYGTVTVNDGYVTISQGDIASSGTATLTQPIENAKDYAGMTLTFTAKARGTNGRIALNIQDSNSDTEIYLQPTAEWKTYTIQRTLGNITDLRAGVSIEGTAGNSADFAWAKLEVGNVATMYIPPNQAEELLKCQRYYEKGTPIMQNKIGTKTLSGMHFMVEKRIDNPTVTLYGTILYNDNFDYSSHPNTVYESAHALYIEASPEVINKSGFVYVNLQQDPTASVYYCYDVDAEIY